MDKHVFLSYRSTQSKFAVGLAKALEGAGIRVWLDQLGGIEGGDDWQLAIQKGLDTCAILIAVLSPEYVNSTYCQIELARAKRLGKTILPILLETIVPTDIPLEVERIQYFDFRDWTNVPFSGSRFDSLVERVRYFLTKETQPIKRWESYLVWAINDFRPPPGASWLRDPERIYLPLTMAESDRENVQDAFSMTDHYLNTQGVALVVGGYGTGKSFFARKLFLNMAKDYLDGKQSRLPILFPLKQFYGQGPDLILQQILQQLRTNGLPNLTQPELLRLFQSGQALCILDGFDEIPLLFIYSSPMSELDRLVKPLRVGTNQIVVTTRPGVFDAPIAAGDLSSLGIGYIQPWGESMWHEYLRVCEQQGWDFAGGYQTFYEQIIRSAALRQLTTTPLYCQMLVETSERLAQQPELNLAALYQLYIEQYLDSVSHRSVIKEPSIKIEALMATATGMLQAKQLSLTRPQIADVLLREARHLSDHQLRAFADTDTLVFSLLVTDRDQRFSFSHKSFYEYFVAAKAHRELTFETGEQRFALLRREFFTREIIDFLSSLLKLEDPSGFCGTLEQAFQNPKPLQVLQLPGIETVLLRNLLLLALTLYGRLEGIRAEGIDLTGVSLVNQPAYELLNVKLSRGVFIGANLQGGILRGSSLRAAKLNRCVLDKCDLRKVDFGEADLSDITCTETRFSGADFDGVLIHKREAARIKAALYQEQAAYSDSVDEDWLEEAIEIIDECILPD